MRMILAALVFALGVGTAKAQTPTQDEGPDIFWCDWGSKRYGKFSTEKCEAISRVITVFFVNTACPEYELIQGNIARDMIAHDIKGVDATEDGAFPEIVRHNQKSIIYLSNSGRSIQKFCDNMWYAYRSGNKYEFLKKR